jgi:hypothetical protein
MENSNGQAACQTLRSTSDMYLLRGKYLYNKIQINTGTGIQAGLIFFNILSLYVRY